MTEALATRIDRFHGVEPGPAAVAAPLESMRGRTLALFRTLDEDDWQTRSRCTSWTVHDVVRHLVDVANIESALLRGEGPRTADGRVNPTKDPDEWLEGSRGQTPAETVAAFGAAVAAEQKAFEHRIDGGGDELLPGPYGPLHWTSLAAHLFWDAWLHERDIVVPLGLQHECTLAENRLAALYALLIASTTPTFFGSTLTAAIEITGSASGTYEIASSADRASVLFTDTNGEAKLHAELGPLVDSLAGRGPDVEDVIDGPADVIASLTLLRGFLLPTA